MLSFLKGSYTKREIYTLKGVMNDALFSLHESWVECNYVPDMDCENCYAKNVCKDLKRIITYLSDVENSVETVDN